MKHPSDFKSYEDYLDWYNSRSTPDQIAHCRSLGKWLEDEHGHSVYAYYCRGQVDEWIEQLKDGSYWLCERG